MVQTITELFNNVYAAGSPGNTSGSLSFTAANIPSNSSMQTQPFGQPQLVDSLDGFSQVTPTASMGGGLSLPSISTVVGPELKLVHDTKLASPFRNTANVRVIG